MGVDEEEVRWRWEFGWGVGLVVVEVERRSRGGVLYRRQPRSGAGAYLRESANFTSKIRGT